MCGTREKLIELLSQVQYLGGLEEKVADHLIANGVTVQQWIPVTERLPDSMANRVLACDKSGRVFFTHYEDYRGVDLWYDLSTFSDRSVEEAYDVTHWMPLPEAPKGE